MAASGAPLLLLACCMVLLSPSLPSSWAAASTQASPLSAAAKSLRRALGLTWGPPADHCGDCGVGPVCGKNGKTYPNECQAMCGGTSMDYPGACRAWNPPKPTCTLAMPECKGRSGRYPTDIDACAGVCPFQFKVNKALAKFASAKYPKATFPVCWYIRQQCEAACDKLSSTLKRSQSAASAETTCMQGCYGMDRTPCYDAVAVPLEVGSGLCWTASSKYCGSPFYDSTTKVKRAWTIRSAFQNFIKNGAC